MNVDSVTLKMYTLKIAIQNNNITATCNVKLPCCQHKTVNTFSVIVLLEQQNITISKKSIYEQCS